ncbi:MAG TPA: hypothetical protein VFP84_04915, partial [Kofleriaceae bacterium]|nr:hypothetical protein [Kofleriaceae bacterium]
DPEAIAAEAAAKAPAPVDKLPVPLPVLIAGGAGLLVLIGLVLFVVMKKKKAIPEPTPTLALPAPVGELERVLEARPGLPRAQTETGDDGQPLLPARPVRERVLDAVRADVDRTAGVLTAWLAEAPKKGAK